MYSFVSLNKDQQSCRPGRAEGMLGGSWDPGMPRSPWKGADSLPEQSALCAITNGLVNRPASIIISASQHAGTWWGLPAHLLQLTEPGAMLHCKWGWGTPAPGFFGRPESSFTSHATLVLSECNAGTGRSGAVPGVRLKIRHFPVVSCSTSALNYYYYFIFFSKQAFKNLSSSY